MFEGAQDVTIEGGLFTVNENNVINQRFAVHAGSGEFVVVHIRPNRSEQCIETRYTSFEPSNFTWRYA